MESFIDELIKEAEEKEELRTAAYYDLLLLEISNLQDQIADNFSEVEKEIELINRFALSRNATIQNKIDWLSKKLESYIKEKGEKTIELPHGILKMHKKPDRVEIIDIDLFLKNANKDLLEIIPESYKASLSKIKQWIKSKPVPKGVTIIEGNPEFSYTLTKETKDGRSKETGNSRIESTCTDEIALRQSA